MFSCVNGVCCKAVNIHWTPLLYEMLESFASNLNIWLVKTRDCYCEDALWLSPQSIAAFASNIVYVETRLLCLLPTKESLILSAEITQSFSYTPKRSCRHSHSGKNLKSRIFTLIQQIGVLLSIHYLRCNYIWARYSLCVRPHESLCWKLLYIPQRLKL